MDRVMARDELILYRNYKTAVPVSMMSGSTYQAQQNVSGGGCGAYWHWDNDIWRVTFIVSGDENFSAVFSQFYGGHVLSYYSSSSNHIVLITPNDSSTSIDPATLAHELTHAIQD